MKRRRTKSERGRVQPSPLVGRGIAERVSASALPYSRMSTAPRPSILLKYLMLRLVRPVEAVALCLTSSARYGCRRAYSGSSTTSPDPLNILFCGADEFSIYSLRALRELQSKTPEKIAAINVVCRPDKYVGRGLRRIQEGQHKSSQ